MTVDEQSLQRLEQKLLNLDGSVPLHDRFRALFALKSIGGEPAVSIIAKGFSDHSALLKHELAYVLGQIDDPCAVPTLTSVLENPSEDPMVRHEAAEALGAISSTSCLPTLRKYLQDPERVVRETCEIAIAKIQWDASPEGLAAKATRDAEKREAAENGTIRRFTSIDPAPPSLETSKAATSSLMKGPPNSNVVTVETVEHLRSQLLDRNLPLFKRYRAMFGLRNIGSPAAIDALADGFSDDSALFKHEIAFVFGQLADQHAVPALLKVLQSTSESDMVRHEAAEALGGIELDKNTPIVVDGQTVDVLNVLKEWTSKTDAPLVVQQSCQVAVDMWEYENSATFQYADGITKAPSTGGHLVTA